MTVWSQVLGDIHDGAARADAARGAASDHDGAASDHDGARADAARRRQRQSPEVQETQERGRVQGEQEDVQVEGRQVQGQVDLCRGRARAFRRRREATDHGDDKLPPDRKSVV